MVIEFHNFSRRQGPVEIADNKLEKGVFSNTWFSPTSTSFSWCCSPHEGSTIARIASIYDKDPLLNDLSDASDNTFLTQLENNWRGHDSVNGIHRFCAYESEDTRPENGVGRYLKTHARVVSYFSATYGCDVTTPPQEIHADHVT